MPVTDNHIADNLSPALEKYKGSWGSNEVIHLLKRTMFGAKKADVDHFKKKTLEQTVEELLNPLPLDREPPINDYDFVGVQSIAPGKTWVGAPYYEEHEGFRIGSFAKWSMDHFIHQEKSLEEKMMVFWHNHFATQANILRSNLIWEHYKMLRTHALGNFKTITKLVTLDGHMLRYLNGEQNTNTAPNENYARELQELFCIGKGPNAKYTEDDVKQAAKVLTGWKIDYTKEIVLFKEEDHDTSDKKFSGFYKNRIITGKKGPSAGMEELDALLNMIFDNEETALFLCRKIYRWFVNSTIDDETEKKIIEPLAQTLRKNNYEIKPVLKQLFTSKHFYDPLYFGAQIKSPLDFIVGLQREFNVEYAKPENYIVNNNMYLMLLETSALMGQSFGEPPNVSGWPAYYQSPGFYELWINTSTYPARNDFSTTMINYGYNREGRFFIADVIAFAKGLIDPGNPDSLINESIELLYRVPVSDSSKNELKKNILLSGQEQDHYWTDAWEDYIKAPEDASKKGVVELRLKSLYHFIVSSPEYQLC